MSRIKKIIELTKELNENCKHLKTPEGEQPTNWENEYPLNTFSGETKIELIQFIQTQIDKNKAELLESAGEIILVKAVSKFNSTPQIGESFDIEKHNHTNKMLNGMTDFIYKEIKSLLK